MEIKNLPKTKILKKLLKITDKQLFLITKHYRLENVHDEELFIKTIQFVLRDKKINKFGLFTKNEWIVVLLFFRFGMKLGPISKLFEKSEAQIKSYYFSGKEKLLALESRHEL